MNNLLVKLFVNDSENYNDKNVRKQYGYLSAGVGIVCNILLFVFKFIVGFLTHSISIISDGFNNMSDCASCVITLFGYKLAAKPADKDHPFGHGRMEYLISMIISMVIMVVGFELFKNSIDRIIHPVEVSFNVVALIVLIVSMLIKVWMGLFNMGLGKKIDSSVMKATATDSFSDVFATLATAIALIASCFTTFPVDGIMGIIVSVLVMMAGYGIIKETIDQLLGQPADEETVKAIKKIVEASEVSKGMHDLIIHNYGPGNQIGSVHIEVDSRGDIMAIHDAIDVLEHMIYTELNIQMTIHMDPIDFQDENQIRCKNMMITILHGIHPTLNLHDFRIVSGPTHTNLVFDVVVPYEIEMTEQEIKEKIDTKLREMDQLYFTVITFDKEFC